MPTIPILGRTNQPPSSGETPTIHIIVDEAGELKYDIKACSPETLFLAAAWLTRIANQFITDGEARQFAEQMQAQKIAGDLRKGRKGN